MGGEGNITLYSTQETRKKQELTPYELSARKGDNELSKQAVIKICNKKQYWL